jgi:hypothetical protein
MHIGHQWESKNERDIGGWIILKWILEIGLGGMVWINLAQDRDQWKALVNTAMNFWVP